MTLVVVFCLGAGLDEIDFMYPSGSVSATRKRCSQHNHENLFHSHQPTPPPTTYTAFIIAITWIRLPTYSHPPTSAVSAEASLRFDAEKGKVTCKSIKFSDLGNPVIHANLASTFL